MTKKGYAKIISCRVAEREMLRQHCVEEADGTLVRGVVPKIYCPNCKADRFDDGTQCGCGMYSPGVYTSRTAHEPKFGVRPMPWEAA